MEKVHSKDRSVGVAPEMRVAGKGENDGLDVERFVKDLEEVVTAVGENEEGLSRSVYTPQWFAHFSRALDFLSWSRSSAPTS